MTASPRPWIPLCWPLLLTLALLVGCRGNELPAYTTRFMAFDSEVELRLLGLSETLAPRLAEEIERDFRLLDHELSLSGPSPLHRVNELLATGEPFAAPPSLLPLLAHGQELAERSGQLFNPAIGLLVRAWGFHETDCPNRPPRADAIARLVAASPKLSDIASNGMLLQSDNPAVSLDFHAIRKGYAIDLAIAYLREHGVRNAMVKIGNDLRVIGDQAGKPWRIPVTRASGAGVFGVLTVSGDASVMTSTTTHRDCRYRDKTFHHILDPRTGYPASGALSVTVLGGAGALVADAGATTLLVAGVADWERVARDLGITAALLFDPEGRAHLTSAMSRRLEIVDKTVAIQAGIRDTGAE